MAVPQIQKWSSERSKNNEPITLGSLSDAAPYYSPLAPGVVRVDRDTLRVLLEAFSHVDWDWLRTFDFGGSFEYSAITPIQYYALQHNNPTDEFLDAELEKMRSALISATLKFVNTAVRNTLVTFRHDDDQTRRVPDTFGNQYDERLFFQKAREINDTAEAVCNAYDALVRRARMKLALAEPSDEGKS